MALSANQVAWLIGVSPNTVWNLLSDGQLASFSVGRRRLIARSAVEDFIARGGTKPEGSHAETVPTDSGGKP